jgi:hypothetical protein
MRIDGNVRLPVYKVRRAGMVGRFSGYADVNFADRAARAST